MLPLSPEQRQGGRSSAQGRRGGRGPAARAGPGCEEPAPNPPPGLQRAGKSKISGAGAVGRDWGAQPSPFIVALLGWGCRAGLGCSQHGARAPQRCCSFVGPLAAHSPSVREEKHRGGCPVPSHRPPVPHLAPTRPSACCQPLLSYPAPCFSRSLLAFRCRRKGKFNAFGRKAGESQTSETRPMEM